MFCVTLIVESKFLGPIYEEECYCPNSSIDSWLENLKCLTNYTQIHSDLIPFTNVNFDKIRENVIKAYNRPESISLCHYIVQSNKVSVTTVCKFDIDLELFFN